MKQEMLSLPITRTAIAATTTKVGRPQAMISVVLDIDNDRKKQQDNLAMATVTKLDQLLVSPPSRRVVSVKLAAVDSDSYRVVPRKLAVLGSDCQALYHYLKPDYKKIQSLDKVDLQWLSNSQLTTDTIEQLLADHYLTVALEAGNCQTANRLALMTVGSNVGSAGSRIGNRVSKQLLTTPPADAPASCRSLLSWLANGSCSRHYGPYINDDLVDDIRRRRSWSYPINYSNNYSTNNGSIGNRMTVSSSIRELIRCQQIDFYLHNN